MSDAERRADERDALKAILGVDAVEYTSASTMRVRIKDEAFWCDASLRTPDDYPSSSALDVHAVVSDALNREHEAAIVARAREVARASVGEESAYAVVAELEQSFKEVLAEARAARESARTTTTVEEDYHAVVRIDTCATDCAASGLPNACGVYKQEEAETQGEAPPVETQRWATSSRPRSWRNSEKYSTSSTRTAAARSPRRSSASLWRRWE